jgi:hypothetical protein
MVSLVSLSSAAVGQRLLPLAAREERQVIAHHIDRDGRKHENESDPEAPIPVRTFPVRIRFMTNTVASGFSVLVGAMLRLIHLDEAPIASARISFSIAALYSPRRAVRLHLAR